MTAAANGHPNLVHERDVAAEEMAYGDMRCERRRLAVAAGATAIGASLFTVPPDARQMPPHVHSDEEEIFFVVVGSGLLWQDGATYAVARGDTIVYRAGSAAHTLIAGGDGLTVLACGEGAATPVTYLPRTKTFWLGKRWLPADGPSPFRQEVVLGAVELPDAPEAQRPANVAHVDEVALERVVRGGYDLVDRDAGRACGSHRAGLRHVVLAPGTRSCPPHWHSAEEELFYVLDGDGEALLGEAAHPIEAGSVLVRPPGTQIPHQLRAGADGLTYVAFGTRVPGDLCVFPRSGKVSLGGMTFRLAAVDYWEGEEDPPA